MRAFEPGSARTPRQIWRQSVFRQLQSVFTDEHVFWKLPIKVHFGIFVGICVADVAGSAFDVNGF